LDKRIADQVLDRLSRASNGELLSWEEYLEINRKFYRGVPYRTYALIDPTSIERIPQNLRSAIAVNSDILAKAKQLAYAQTDEEIALIQYELLSTEMKKSLVWPVSYFAK
jgi:hypothetical protein